MIPSIIRPISIGSLQLPSNILFAPLAGCSDFPYRAICRQFHDGLLFCEMVKMEAILRSDASSFRMLHYSADLLATLWENQKEASGGPPQHRLFSEDRSLYQQN